MGRRTREYFYTVDRDGRLRHDGAVLEDERFLRFFFGQLRVNDTGRHRDFAFVSPCGTELNFVAPEATVIVFRRLTPAGELEYGAGMAVPFDPGELRVSDDGRLYHRAPVGEFGLLCSSLAVRLAEHIEERGDGFAWVGAAGSRRIPPLSAT